MAPIRSSTASGERRCCCGGILNIIRSTEARTQPVVHHASKAQIRGAERRVDSPNHSPDNSSTELRAHTPSWHWQTSSTASGGQVMQSHELITREASIAGARSAHDRLKIGSQDLS